MTFDIITLFPEVFEPYLKCGILGKAIVEEKLTVNLHHLRPYGIGKHLLVDDYPFGGGAGMVLKVDVIDAAITDITKDYSDTPFRVLLSPQGKMFSHEIAMMLKAKDHVLLCCGHYGGVDERVAEHLIDYELSVGDFVLSGGELAAMLVIDVVARLVEGVVGNNESIEEDCFYDGLLAPPAYTRPAVYKEWEVPEVLLSGHHANIEKWRRQIALERTKTRRPDLLKPEIN